ncbi:MAG: hypothetical protein ACRD16_00485 [Thermoanaerobaculia bacterium]
MISPCLDAPALGSFLSDELDRASRAAATEHLRACADCRLRALESDPAVVFRLALAPEPPVSEEESRQILENVRVAIAIREASRKIERPAAAGLGFRRSAAAFAAVALLSLTVSSPVTRRSAARPRISPASSLSSAPSAFARAAATERSDDTLSPATARVYEWTPRANSPDDPKIVWIVDRSLDL